VAKRALVVDDSATIRLLVADTLQQAGFGVTIAENGQRALDTLDDGPFQLIVSDLNMPIMDGLTFVAQARCHAEHKYAPIVLLTAETSKSKVSAAKAAGATAWLVKPFNREKLLAIVSKVAR
jgi:two-component system chemotaxis response regulator CheY